MYRDWEDDIVPKTETGTVALMKVLEEKQVEFWCLALERHGCSVYMIANTQIYEATHNYPNILNLKIYVFGKRIYTKNL